MLYIDSLDTSVVLKLQVGREGLRSLPSGLTELWEQSD